VDGLSNEELIKLVFTNPSALDEAPFPTPDKLLDVANMNFQNFTWAISCVGLQRAKFDTYKTAINHLTSLRHDCAHGEVITFDATRSDRELANAMFGLQSTIISLVHELAVELVDHFQNRRYRAA
jgi:hypothetical protein